MKRLFISIIVIILNLHTLFSQDKQGNIEVFFRDAITESVPVFKTKTDTICIATIKENNQDENWHDIEILEKSKKRYKVIITSFNEFPNVVVEGWVDREQCGVWLHGKLDVIHELWTVNIYSKPGSSHPKEILIDRNYGGFVEFDNGKAVPVIDYKYFKGKYWIKTVITKNGKKVVGWTTDYCPNVYDSCC